jgi:hypothetical protein
MSSDWSRKRGREGEERGTPEERKEGDPQAPPPGPPPAPHPNVPRYPGSRVPEGYYQPLYPPPAGEGGPPSAYPPPRGYEGAPPYGMPPPMPGYPMYPYQAPMYPHYPGYPPPPMSYGYPPPGDPSMVGHPGVYPQRDEQGAIVGPYGGVQPPAAPAGTAQSSGSSNQGKEEDQKQAAAAAEQLDDGDDDDDDDVESVGGHGARTARLKTYIKPRMPSTQDVVDRRTRKNAQSRSRAAKLRQRISEIEKRQAEDRTEEEKAIFDQFESRRQRKNDRSRERALEKKEEIDRILAKPEKKRTKIEKAFLVNALGAKKRKNEGDRLRRQRLKQLGLASKGPVAPKPGMGGRGVMPKFGQPPHLHHMPPQHHPYGGHMGEIPMSPMPPMAGHHTFQSPGGFGSPGMMHGMGFPSPQHRGRPGGSGPPGAMETPGRAPGPGAALPYMPPAQSFDPNRSPNTYPPHEQHQAHDQHPQSRVEQRRNPDGSMSISIGGGGSASASAFGGEAKLPGTEEQSSMNISDVSHLLLYDNGDDGDTDGGHGEEANEGDNIDG